MFKRFKMFILSAAVVFGVLVQPVYAEDAVADITIYHTNDMHGYVQADEGVIGLGKIAALKQNTPNSILVDAGDATQGLPIASLTKGADIISLMNTAGYDVMAAGNHEFDYGVDILLRNVQNAAFPIISSNILYNGTPLLEEQTIIERNGYRIGFFGITTTGTASSTNPEGLQGVEFTDEKAAAQAQVESLETADVDAIIGIMHCGDSTAGAPVTAEEIAESVPGIDVIIDGHSHTVENMKETSS